MNEIKRVVYTPPEVAKLAIDTLEELRQSSDAGVKTGIDMIDDKMLPMRPAELVVVMGYTSWYKSGFMNFVLRNAASKCKENEIVIKVTWEDSVEEDTLKWMASDMGMSISTLMRGESLEWKAVMGSYTNRLNTPIWIIGHSNRQSADEKRTRPRMTMTDVMSAVEYIRETATDNKFHVKLIVLDYLQRIRPDASDGGTKREQMMEAVNKAKDMAIAFGCPVMLGVQASRGVLEREFKLPRLDDGQETSNIEQSADKVLSLWYPIKTEPGGSIIESIGASVTQNLLVCGLLKQKLGYAPLTFPLYVEPDKNNIIGMEVKHVSA